MNNIESKIRAALNRYDMIETGDRVAICVSGGKDSVALLSAISHIRSYYHKEFDIISVTVDAKFNDKQADFSELQSLCKKLKINCVIKTTNLSKLIFEDRKEKNPCSLCSKVRRGILSTLAKDNKCNKIALGHHYDDVVQTFFMNLFNGGRIDCFAPKSYLTRKEIWVIRPLIFCKEKEVVSYVNSNNLPIVKSLCPVDGKTNRANTERLIQIIEKTIPNIRSKILKILQREHINNW